MVRKASPSPVRTEAMVTMIQLVAPVLASAAGLGRERVLTRLQLARFGRARALASAQGSDDHRSSVHWLPDAPVVRCSPCNRSAR